MEKIKALLESFCLALMGKSWKTTLVGYMTAAGIALVDYVNSHGDLAHMDLKAVMAAVGLALLGRFAKDHNLSNSPLAMPIAEAAPVADKK